MLSTVPDFQHAMQLASTLHHGPAMNIPLANNRGVAIVDDCFGEQVNALKWQARRDHGNWYAVRSVKINGKRKLQSLHRYVWELSGRDPVQQLDHKNGNGLDNQLANLRPATSAENNRNRGRQANNTSGFKGVSWSKQKRKWRSRIWVNGRGIHLGYFDDPFQASLARDHAAIEQHGEFARTDFGIATVDDLSCWSVDALDILG